MITVTCPGCQALLKVPETLSGKKAKCNKCATVFQVPQISASIAARPTAAAPTAPTRVAPLQDEPPRSAARRQPEKPADDLEFADDSPRRKSRKKSGAPVLLLAIGGVVALFLLAGIATGVFFFLRSGSGRVPGLKWMPNNSQLLVSVRLADIRNSDAAKDLKAAIPDTFNKLMEQATKGAAKEGMPLEFEDMTTLTVGMANLEAATKGGNPDVVACLVTSKAIKAEDMVAKIKNKTFNAKPAGPYTLYEAGNDSFCVVDSNTILGGPSAALRAVLERNAEPVLSAKLQEALADVSPSKAIVMVFEIPAAAAQALNKGGNGGGFGGGLDALGTLPEKLEAVAVEIGITKDVDIRSVVTCKDATGSETVVNLTNLMKNAVALKSPPDLQKIFSGVQATASGRKATITSSFTVGPLAQAMKKNLEGLAQLPLGGFGQQPPPFQPPPFQPPQFVVPEVKQPGTWTTDLAEGQEKQYNVVCFGGRKMEFRVTSDRNTDVDTWVFDQNDVLVASDTRIDKNCYVSWTPPNLQTYKIKVKNLPGGVLGPGPNHCRMELTAGPEQVVIQPPPPPPPPPLDPPPPVGKLTVLNFRGVLRAIDPQDKSRIGSHHKLHTVALNAGKTYIIDMKSKQFDSYLRLENSFGQQLAFDDDSGGFPDARIVFFCPNNGVYRVIATSFAPGATGQYTLTVREQ